MDTKSLPKQNNIEFGGQILSERLRVLLEFEEKEYRNQTFPADHPYGDSLKRTLKHGYLNCRLEAVIARHCLFVCARLIERLGTKAVNHPIYTHYFGLLEELPTDWLNEQNADALADTNIWH